MSWPEAVATTLGLFFFVCVLIGWPTFIKIERHITYNYQNEKAKSEAD